MLHSVVCSLKLKSYSSEQFAYEIPVNLLACSLVGVKCPGWALETPQRLVK
jgi:hypothetical protein